MRVGVGDHPGDVDTGHGASAHVIAVAPASHSSAPLREAGADAGIGLVLVSKVLDALDALDELLEQSLEDGRGVRLGSMNVEHVVRNAREGRNPQTGEAIEVPAHGAVKITPSAALKRAARKADPNT